MKKPSRKTVLLVLVVLCTGFIFSNSLKDAPRSLADSGAIVEAVEQVAQQVKPDNSVNWTYYVRKSAHLVEFCALGLLTMGLALQLTERRWTGAGAAALYGLGIAATDEWIQKFTGRSARLEDVALDTAGAVLGIGLILLADWLRRRKVCE